MDRKYILINVLEGLAPCNFLIKDYTEIFHVIYKSNIRKWSINFGKLRGCYMWATIGKPFTDGNIIKEYTLMMEAVTELCPKKLNLLWRLRLVTRQIMSGFWILLLGLLDISSGGIYNYLLQSQSHCNDTSLIFYRLTSRILLPQLFTS
jgi:hypothetical protein